MWTYITFSKYMIDMVSVNRYPWYPGDDADVEFKDAIIKSSL